MRKRILSICGRDVHKNTEKDGCVGDGPETLRDIHPFVGNKTLRQQWEEE